jgi:hypothetical protein
MYLRLHERFDDEFLLLTRAPPFSDALDELFRRLCPIDGIDERLTNRR